MLRGPDYLRNHTRLEQETAIAVFSLCRAAGATTGRNSQCSATPHKKRGRPMKRVEVGLCHPDRKDRVFLSETLRSGDFVAETAPDPASGDELQTAYDQRKQRHYRFDPVIRCILPHQERDRVAGYGGQCDGPHVERKFLPFFDFVVHTGKKPSQQHGQNERQGPVRGSSDGR